MDISVIETGTATLRDPSSTTDHNNANYDLVVTVTGSKPGTYSCYATVDKFDGVNNATNPEPQLMHYSASQTITVNGKYTLSMYQRPVATLTDTSL